MSKNRLHRLSLLFIFVVVSACFSSANISSDIGSKNDNRKYKDSDFLLLASAEGTDEEDARKKALGNLSQLIFVDVNSSLSSQETLSNSDFDIKVQNELSVNSMGFFQGVSFYGEEKLNKNRYRISVGLTERSYKQSINYLKDQINFDEEVIENTPKHILSDILIKADFTLVLMSFGKAKGISYNQDDYNDILEYKKKVEVIINSPARVRFLVMPKNENVKITLNNRDYKAYRAIFLADGRYNYEVKLDGYQIKRGVLSFSRGDNRDISIFMQKTLASPLLVELIVANQSNISSGLLRGTLRSILSDNQMRVVDTSTNRIEFSFGKESVSPQISNLNSVNVLTSIDVYKGGKLEQSFSFNINYLTRNTSKPMPEDIVNKQIIDKTEEFFALLYN